MDSSSFVSRGTKLRNECAYIKENERGSGKIKILDL
jgi:hypothetical protein